MPSEEAALGLVGRADDTEQRATIDPPAVEPSHSTAQEAHCRRPLLAG